MTTTQGEIAARGARRLQECAGISRANNPAEIAKWMAYTTGEADANLAFCISGICFHYGVAWLDVHGTAYTPDDVVAVLNAHRAAIEADLFPVDASVSDLVGRLGNRFVSADAIGPDVTLPVGTVVFYTWPDGGHHAEALLEDGGDTLKTVGANVCHGQVLDESRSWACLWGFWMPQA